MRSWHATVDGAPDAEAIVFEGRCYTFAQLDELANRFAHWATAGLGLVKGDVVALLMENCAHFVAAWLGFAKVGVIASLLNTNVRGAQLVHCIRIRSATPPAVRGAARRGAPSDVRGRTADHGPCCTATNWPTPCATLPMRWTPLRFRRTRSVPRRRPRSGRPA